MDDTYAFENERKDLALVAREMFNRKIQMLRVVISVCDLRQMPLSIMELCIS